VTPDVFDRLVENTEDLVAIFYDPTKKKHMVLKTISLPTN